MDTGICQSTMQLILTWATLILTKAFTNYFYLSGRQYWDMRLIKKLTNLQVHLTDVIFHIKQTQTCTPNFNWVFGLFQVDGILILTLHLDIFIVMKLLCLYNLKSQMRCYQQWIKTRVTKNLTNTVIIVLNITWRDYKYRQNIVSNANSVLMSFIF
jgi:hypothetical protein